jgi:hypothetical protein
MRRPQHLEQWGVTSRFTARLGPTADLSLSTTFSRTRQQRSALEQQLGVLMSTYLDRATGTYYHGDGRSENFLTNYFERATAAATAFTPGLNLSWRPRGWLTVTGDAGVNVVQRADQIFLPRGAAPRSDSVGHLDAGQGTSVLSTVGTLTEHDSISCWPACKRRSISSRLLPRTGGSCPWYVLSTGTIHTPEQHPSSKPSPES